MIISLPLTVLNLFLQYDPVIVQASFIPHQKTTFCKSKTSSSSSSPTLLRARPNRNIDRDPYADLFNKVQTQTDPTTTPQPSADAVDVPGSEPSTIQSIAEKVNDLVDQVNQAAATAVEASQQTSDIVSSVSDKATVTASATATAATAASTAAPTTSEPSTITENVNAAATAIKESTSDLPVDTSSAKEMTEAMTSTATNKVPTLFEYLKSGGAVQDGISPTTKEKIALLKDNIVRPVGNVEESTASAVSGAAKAIANVETEAAKSVISTTSQGIQGLNEVTQSAKTFVYSVGAATAGAGVGAGVDAGATDVQWSLKSVVDNMRFDEYGAWYLAGATFVYAITAKESGRKEAAEKFEAELEKAKEKAEEAAEAAGVATEGAEMAKHLVKEIDPKSSGKNIGEQLLENAKIEELLVENTLIKEKLKRLETQNSQQKILIDKLSPKIVPIKEDVAATPAVKETLERDPEEDAKVLKIVKEIDLKNAKLNASKNVQTKKKKTRATKVEKVKSVVKAKKTKTPAKKKAKNKKKVKSEPVEMEINGSGSTETVVAVAEEPKDELKEMKTAETFFIEAIKEIAVEAAGEIEVDDPDKDILDVIKEIDAKNDAKEIDAGKEIINAIKEIDEKSQVKKGKKKAKKKTVKKAKDATKSTETQVEANPWGSLKESTLKRKTVAQLTAYLAEREVTVAAGASKKELVGTIQNL